MTWASEAVSSTLLHIAWVLFAVFLVLSFACVAALVGIRGRRRLLARRRQVETSALRNDLVAVIVGEEPDATEAARRIAALRGRRWDRADELLVGMLPKVRGAAKERVLAVLMDRGAVERALLEIGSRRSFARCRGAFALGAMAVSEQSVHVVRLLSDRSRLVRRVAIRALGSMGDPAVARPLLNAANDDDGVQRDVVQALIQLGVQAAPMVRERLRYATVRPDANDRSGPAAATVLGLMGDVASAGVLAAALERGPVPVQLAAARALGQLDSPAGAAALQGALSSPSAQVQLAAATSLGRLGATSVVPDLLAAVHQGDPVVARSAASALLALGPAGKTALAGSPAPYAVEAIAIEAMRRSA